MRDILQLQAKIHLTKIRLFFVSVSHWIPRREYDIYKLITPKYREDIRMKKIVSCEWSYVSIISIPGKPNIFVSTAYEFDINHPPKDNFQWEFRHRKRTSLNSPKTANISF